MDRSSTWACSPSRADEVEQWRDSYFIKGNPPEFVRAEISCGPDAVLAAVEAYTAEGADEVQFFLGTDDLARARLADRYRHPDHGPRRPTTHRSLTLSHGRAAHVSAQS